MSHNNIHDDEKGMKKTLEKYQDSEISLKPLLNKTIGILGYGSQGRAQALNLRDSGINVIVGCRKGKSFEKAESDGFKPVSVPDAVKNSDILAFMLPDESAAEIYTKDIEPHLKKGQTLLFAHGFNIHYGFIKPPKDVDVVISAPKGVGPMVRKLFEDGYGVPSLAAVQQDSTGHALEKTLAYAAGIGSGRSAILKSSFKDETETDLFGEQAVICGGVPVLVEAAYNILVDAGYPEELAYSECAHELKLVVDLIYEGGLTKMHEFVSKTASYGGITRGERIIGDESRKEMLKILEEIKSGEFAKEWMTEKNSGSEKYNALVNEVKESDMEKTGRKFRKLIEGKSA
ncbi:MAG TPA: ketol-acid reductoisomerase [Methanocorpusculum sp.]|nr:ketol-acid reductoisomerase [Methanocorpusculum sp.]